MSNCYEEQALNPEFIHFYYINESSKLNDLTQKLYNASVVAIDMEADSFHHYYPKVCLIQISFNGENFVIDPLAGLDLSDFLKELATKKLVFHDSGYDLRMMRQCFAFEPTGEIFDTMLAGKLLGAKSISLAGMLQSFMGITITKGSQKADWSKRPLQESLLRYAAMDTHYLLELAEKLEAILQEQARTGWHKQMCKQSVKAAMNHTQAIDSEKDWRIKGHSHLTPRQLAFLQQLWLWREKQAQAADLPPFRILHNERLIGLSIGADSRTEPDFNDLCQELKHCKGKRLESLHSALNKAFHQKSSQWPQPKSSSRIARPDNQLLARIEKIRKACQKTAEENGLSTELILSRALMTKIAQTGTKGLENMLLEGSILPWQADLIRTPLAEILDEIN
jgi:ribonuclease D